MQSELIVALDVPTAADIGPVVDRLPDEVMFYKVGLELFVAEGPRALAPLQERGKKIFLDLKLHDIPRQVARTITSAGQHGVALMTVHAVGGRAMLQAAAEAAGELGTAAPKLVAVTVLTSLDQSDLGDIGIARSVQDQAMSLGHLAIDSGIDGLVCSAQELTTFRRTLGTEPILVTPGIRPAGGRVGDQKRVATPTDAVRNGSTYLVVGRPILSADDPCAAAQAILGEMKAAMDVA
jgi:orotidine-5'-phosphate decarboxylase